ncbi:hypothetical protein ACJX0J_039394, partial [Zea mays]
RERERERDLIVRASPNQPKRASRAHSLLCALFSAFPTLAFPAKGFTILIQIIFFFSFLAHISFYSISAKVFFRSTSKVYFSLLFLYAGMLLHSFNHPCTLHI